MRFCVKGTILAYDSFANVAICIEDPNDLIVYVRRNSRIQWYRVNNSSRMYQLEVRHSSNSKPRQTFFNPRIELGKKKVGNKWFFIFSKASEHLKCEDHNSQTTLKSVLYFNKIMSLKKSEKISCLYTLNQSLRNNKNFF